MSTEDKETLKKKLYEVIGSVVDIEEFRPDSISEKEDAEINNFILSVHDSITTLTNYFKIDI